MVRMPSILPNAHSPLARVYAGTGSQLLFFYASGLGARGTGTDSLSMVKAHEVIALRIKVWHQLLALRIWGLPDSTSVCECIKLLTTDSMRALAIVASAKSRDSTLRPV
jgi:hypothetical protein